MFFYLFVFVYSTTLYGTHATFIYFKHCVRSYLNKIFCASITLRDAFTLFSVVDWMIIASKTVCESKFTAGKVCLLLTVNSVAYFLNTYTSLQYSNFHTTVRGAANRYVNLPYDYLYRRGINDISSHTLLLLSIAQWCVRYFCVQFNCFCASK
jgi:hypothetical protein